MSHHVCTGDCKTVSDMPGVCNTESCNKKGQSFEACVCEDGEHKELAGNSTEVMPE